MAQLVLDNDISTGGVPNDELELELELALVSV